MAMHKLILSGILVGIIISSSYAFAEPSQYMNIPPTNAFDKIHSDNGTVSAVNFSMPLIIKGGNNISVQSSNSSHTITISGTTPTNTNQGTYNKTLANNEIINSGGNRLNFINGTNNPVSLVNDPSRNQINITISSTGGTSGVTSLNALTGALSIACISGNTTCTTSGGNTITINTAYNIATLNLNEIFSGITTMNNLKLGGQMNINGKTFQSFNHVYSWPNNTGTVCLTNQTGICGPMGSATYDTLSNIGTGQGSVYAGNTTKTNFQFKTLKQGSNIVITNNTNDVTISSTALSSAIQSINTDTTPGQTIQVIGSGSISDNGGGVHVITTKTYQNNTGANLGTHGIGPFASMNSQVLQFLSLVSANSNCDFTNNSTNLILTCSSPSSITSVNSQTGPSINIVCQTGNTTCTNSTNQIKIGFGSNPLITNGSPQNISKTVTFTSGNKLTLTPSSTTAGINIGTTSNAPTSPRQGDMWIVNRGIKFQDVNNITRTTITSVTSSGQVSVSNNFNGSAVNLSCPLCITTINRGSVTNMSQIINGTNTVSIQMKNNIVLTNESAQTITKQLTLNNGVLGGNLIVTGFGFSNSGHISSLPSTTGTLCQTNQTTTCGSGTGTITTSQNVGKAAGSVGVLATPTSSTIKGRNMTGASPITITKTNDTDISISCSTCLTSSSGGVPTILGNNVTSSSTTAFTHIWNIPLTANSGNAVKGQLIASTNTAGGAVQVGANMSSTSTGSGSCTFSYASAATTLVTFASLLGTTSSDSAWTTILAGANQAYPIYFDCSVQTGSSPPTLQINFQAEVSSTVSIKAGSFYIKTP